MEITAHFDEGEVLCFEDLPEQEKAEVDSPSSQFWRSSAATAIILSTSRFH
jgi:hypothetical protein